MMTRILGVDPGLASIGCGLLELKDDAIKYKASWLLVTSPKNTMAQRLAEIGRDFDQILTATKPDVIAIETLFFTKNVRTCIMVAQARGVILSKCHSLSVVEYSPTQVKLLATGMGKASKKDMKFVIEQVACGLTDDNVIDGIGIALAHARILLNTSDTRQGVKK